MTRNIIFTVNPGATSTKCALYELNDLEVSCVAEKTIEHPDAEINQFAGIKDQIDYRDTLVRSYIEANLKETDQIIACAGRGGMLTPVPSGAIKVNEALVDFSLNSPVYHHASNLGAPIAYEMAKIFNVDAFIVDPVCVDEFSDIARISGSPLFERFSFVHALNIRAMSRKLAKTINKEFDDLRCVIAHMGAGFSIAVLENGCLVDNDNRMEGAAFSPERSGGIPPIPLIAACYSGQYTQQELLKNLYGNGGVYAYLGTRDIREVESRIDHGDKKAEMIYDAMIYQIGKAIASQASVLDFKMDGIILTGGMAYSERLVNRLKEKFSAITDVYVFPGSNENESLAEATARVLLGQEKYMEWPVEYNKNSTDAEL